MAKKKTGKQLDLIEVSPENVKPILKAARLYKEYSTARLAALKEEVKQKQIVLELVKKAKLQRLENGKIKFRCDGVEIEITPRDELVKVREQIDLE